VNVELNRQLEVEVAGSRQLEHTTSLSHAVPWAQHWDWMQAAQAGRGSVTPPQVVVAGIMPVLPAAPVPVPPQFAFAVHTLVHAPHWHWIMAS
jgi:hypothetical protein